MSCWQYSWEHEQVAFNHYFYRPVEAVTDSQGELPIQTGRSKKRCLTSIFTVGSYLLKDLQRIKASQQSTLISETLNKQAWRQSTMLNYYGRRRWGTAKRAMRRYCKASLWKACTIQFVEHFFSDCLNTYMDHLETSHRIPGRALTSKETSWEATSRKTSTTNTTRRPAETNNHEVSSRWVSNNRPHQYLGVAA